MVLENSSKVPSFVVQKILLKIFKYALAVLFVMLFLELLLRIFVPSFVPLNYRLSDGRYWLSPAITTAVYNQESKRVVSLSTTEWGTRDHQSSLESVASSGTRIAVIGDSFVYAAQVEVDERFTAILEKSLVRQGHSSRVFNFGFEGQNVFNYVAWAEYLVANDRADMLVIVVSNADDFLTEKQSGILNGKQITYALDSGTVTRWEQKIDGLQRFRNSALSFARKIFVLRTVEHSLKQGRNILLSDISDTKLWFQELVESFIKKPKKPISKSCPQMFDPDDATVPSGFRIVSRMLSDLKESSSVPVVIVQMPIEGQVSATASSPCNWDKPEAYIQAKLPGTIPLLTHLSGLDKPVFYPGGHLNLYGHHIVANVLADYLSSKN